MNTERCFAMLVLSQVDSRAGWHLRLHTSGIVVPVVENLDVQAFTQFLTYQKWGGKGQIGTSTLSDKGEV